MLTFQQGLKVRLIHRWYFSGSPRKRERVANSIRDRWTNDLRISENHPPFFFHRLSSGLPTRVLILSRVIFRWLEANIIFLLYNLHLDEILLLRTSHCFELRKFIRIVAMISSWLFFFSKKFGFFFPFFSLKRRGEHWRNLEKKIVLVI